MMANSNSLNKEIKKGLYIVPTPIGNLNDITQRAIDVLKNSNYILCEDTRVSKNLLQKYEIKSKLISNHKFNERKNLPKIIKLLKEEVIISLISDAGMPGISDPGAILIGECLKKNIKVMPLPGPSAISSALAVSGYSEKFFFYGFFPEKLKFLKDDLETLSRLNSSIIFFISPKKLNKAIPFIKKNFSGRKICICREMSKIYEEFIRFEVDELKLFSNDLKGELTIVISEKKKIKINSHILSESDKSIIKEMINKLSIKEITKIIYQNNKVPKKIIYNYCLKLKNES
tara:strand:- start:2376 stop:3239 length:864 start_codon:yes stop_codon:yes gene_type:complete